MRVGDTYQIPRIFGRRMDFAKREFDQARLIDHICGPIWHVCLYTVFSENAPKFVTATGKDSAASALIASHREWADHVQPGNGHIVDLEALLSELSGLTGPNRPNLLSTRTSELRMRRARTSRNKILPNGKRKALDNIGPACSGFLYQKGMRYFLHETGLGRGKALGFGKTSASIPGSIWVKSRPR